MEDKRIPSPGTPGPSVPVADSVSGQLASGFPVRKDCYKKILNSAFHHVLVIFFFKPQRVECMLSTLNFFISF